MLQWYESLTALERFFAYVAIPSPLILVIQTVLLIIGLGDAGADAAMDLDADG